MLGVVALVSACGGGSPSPMDGSDATRLDAGADAMDQLDAAAPPSDASGAPRDAIALADSGSDAAQLCRDACDATLPDDFTCTGTDPVTVRAAIIDDCTSRCVELSALVSEPCAACVRDTMMPPTADECAFSTPQITLGVFGTCALSVCDVIFPCSSADACGAGSECLRPCGTGDPWRIWGVCRFPASGTCDCASGAPTAVACATGAACVCPACGDGSGMCVTAPQRASLCFDYTVSPLMEATSRFPCE